MRGSAGNSRDRVLEWQSVVTILAGTEMSYDKMSNDGIYNCIACGKEIAVPIDLPVGTKQQYVDDCPNCNHQNVVHVEAESTGNVRVWVTLPSSESKPLEPFDVVQEASEESFPASDSPAY